MIQTSKSGSSFTYNLHFWLGNDSSQDEQGENKNLKCTSVFDSVAPAFLRLEARTSTVIVCLNQTNVKFLHQPVYWPSVVNVFGVRLRYYTSANDVAIRAQDFELSRYGDCQQAWYFVFCPADFTQFEW